MKLVVIDPGVKNFACIRYDNHKITKCFLWDFSSGVDKLVIKKAGNFFSGPEFQELVEDADKVIVERQYFRRVSKVPILIQRILGVLMFNIPVDKYYESNTGAIKKRLGISTGDYRRNKKAVIEFARPVLIICNCLPHGGKVDDIADCFAMGYYYQKFVSWDKNEVVDPWCRTLPSFSKFKTK